MDVGVDVSKGGASDRYDVVVVGGGIIGLAHARRAAAMGLRVCVVERDDRPRGASVRNFGMVWPVGLAEGPLRSLALRSRELWLEAAAEAGFTADGRGSLHLAHHEDELAVLEEFARDHAAGLRVSMLSASEAASREPGLRHEGLRGALRCEEELAVDPRVAPHAIADHLARRGVAFRWNSVAVGLCPDDGAGAAVTLSGGERLVAGRVLVCSGADLRTLLPAVYARYPVSLVKLRMLRLADPGWRLGAHVAAGPTLTHYPAFAGCAALGACRRRLERERPELGRFGVHVMATQRADGTLVVGDSHEYDDAIEPYDHAEIERIILDYLARMLRLDGLRPGGPGVVDRWHGVYAKRTDGLPLVRERPMPGVEVVGCVGGLGMTLSHALAEQTFDDTRQTDDHHPAPTGARAAAGATP